MIIIIILMMRIYSMYAISYSQLKCCHVQGAVPSAIGTISNGTSNRQLCLYLDRVQM